jgi:IS1 family transposase
MSSKENSVLLAGPWIGEFGWELFCWQAYIRKISKKFSSTIIIGRPGNQIIYNDFCDEYIEFDPKSYKTDGWRCYDALSAEDIVNKTNHTHYIDGTNFDIGMEYTQRGVLDKKGIFFSEQEFIKYKPSHRSNFNFDLIFHCRNKRTGFDRNWSKKHWEELFCRLPNSLRIACIGNKEAFYIKGCRDLRGVNVDQCVDAICQSKLVIGPSSGPMHLASLCGAQHLVWSTEYNRVRYEKDWNPFKSRVIFYSFEDWNPTPENIKNKIISVL